MAREIARLPDVVIANGASLSNILEGISLSDAHALLIGFLSGDTAKTYTIQLSRTPKATSASTWYTLNDGGANVTAPNTANVASIYPWLGFSLRISASAAVASATTFEVSKIWEA